ncbi:MAG: hypothetical protein R2711_17615 [Acidimicrobiales bacterium]
MGVDVEVVEVDVVEVDVEVVDDPVVVVVDVGGGLLTRLDEPEAGIEMTAGAAQAAPTPIRRVPTKPRRSMLGRRFGVLSASVMVLPLARRLLHDRPQMPGFAENIEVPRSDC